MKLQALSETEAKEIHETGLRVLAEIGVRFGDGQTREMLSGAGCGVEGELVKMPPQVVEAALRKCPERITLSGRNGQKVTIGKGKLLTHSTGGCRNVIDRHSGQERCATIEDLNELIRLLDALPQFDIVMPLVTAGNVPPGSMMIHCFASAVRHSAKPAGAPGLHYAAEVRYVSDICRAIRPAGEPLTMAPISPISPLNYPADICKAMREAAERGLPVLVLPCLIAGLSAPLTLAGVLAQQHAENLAGVVLLETARPGAAVVYCSRATTMNLYTGEAVMGAPELGMMGACAVQLAKLIGLPSDVYGLGTSAPDSDVQAGYDKAINVLVPALAGADIVSGGGSLGSAVTGSFEQLVIDNEILATIRRVLAGVSVNSDTLARQVIADEAKGEMAAAHEHTISHLRSGDTLIPALAVRNKNDRLLPLARTQAAKLLQTHTVPPLPEKTESEIHAIIQEADRELSNR